jgi:hypothetical protein
VDKPVDQAQGPHPSGYVFMAKRVVAQNLSKQYLVKTYC